MVVQYMRLPEARDLFVRELTFPATREEAIDAAGDRVLEMPNGGTETVGEVLDRGSPEEFNSVDELYDSLMLFVSEGFVGRQSYDDRGGTHSDSEGQEEVSF